MPADTKFNLLSELLKQITNTFYYSLGNWIVCLYALAFLLPGRVFSCLSVGLMSRSFLFLSVTFYYFLIEKINLRHILVCTFYPFFSVKMPSNSTLSYSSFFVFRVISNFISSQSPFLLLRVASNSIFLYTRHSRTCHIFNTAVANNIFFIGNVNMIIKPIAEYIR